MALLRSGRRTSSSSSLSTASIRSWKSASDADPETASHADGLAIRHTKRVRKTLSSNGSVEEGRVSFLTVSTLMEASDEALIRPSSKVRIRCIVLIATHLVRCHRLASPAMRASADGSVGPGLANPGVRGLAFKTLSLGVH